jgi:site-specific recombinase XerD
LANGPEVRAAQKYGTPRDRALSALLLHAGLRVSEAVKKENLINLFKLSTRTFTVLSK